MTTSRQLMPAAALARLLSARPSGRPAYQGLAGAVRGLILDGRVGVGTRLPAERTLARALSLSRTTVSSAYNLLRQDGYMSSRRGAGSVATLPESRSTMGPMTGGDPRGKPRVDLSVAALPAPLGLVAAVAQAAEQLTRHLGDRGYEPYGLSELREAVAEEYRRGGLPTEMNQVLITAGAQHALAIVLDVLISPAETLLVESPTWPGALDLLRASRGRVVSVGLNSAGWDVEMIGSAFENSRPRLAYLIPDFHNPTGQLMDEATRAAVVAGAVRSGSHLVVDETFRALNFHPAGAPRSTAVFDAEERVIAIGSMSKSHWGGLRVGWIRAGPDLIGQLARAKARRDGASPVLEQLVATALLAGGDAAVAERVPTLVERRDALTSALAEELPGWRFRVPSGGLSLWVELDAPISTLLCRTAAAEGIDLVPGPRFGAAGTMERFLRVPFIVPPHVLEAVTRRLAAIRQDLDPRQLGGPERWYIA